MAAPAAGVEQIVQRQVYIRGANRPFGEFTAEDARERADELSAATGWGPTARVAASRLPGASCHGDGAIRSRERVAELDPDRGVAGAEAVGGAAGRRACARRDGLGKRDGCSCFRRYRCRPDSSVPWMDEDAGTGGVVSAAVFVAAILGLNVLGWGLFLYYARGNPALAGLGHAGLHVRPAPRVRRRSHRGDRQHHAEAAPGRQAAARRRVLLLARATRRSCSRSSPASRSPPRRSNSSIPAFQDYGGYIGASVSGTFLWIIGILNLLVLIDIVADLPRHASAATTTRSSSRSGCSTAAS